MVKPPPDARLSLWALMANHLRHMRIWMNLRQHDVAKILDCSISQVSKYETGDKQLDEKQCKALDAAWHTGQLFETLHYFAVSGENPNWSERLNTFQTSAIEHKIFANNLVPFPFQVEGYAWAFLEAGYADGTITDVEAAVARRMNHQAAILRGDPQIWLLLDEVAVRPMCDNSTMRKQIDHLLTVSTWRNVSVRILPSNTPLGADGSFWWFELPDHRTVAFAGTVLDVGRIIDGQESANRARLRFDRLATRAWSQDQSREWLIERREDT
ncbi:helix-turn-helix domain-containing protein [Actinomadura oligospora]|uniref:helix-turn-helix domain-containing protein n=1 Tax=Actinomadura oligospora TaxID=111804 RepID=UPI00047C1A05|nr:helix-turn-helix transcriptional regulator [Actinomadura oligospora]